MGIGVDGMRLGDVGSRVGKARWLSGEKDSKLGREEAGGGTSGVQGGGGERKD